MITSNDNKYKILNYESISFTVDLELDDFVIAITKSILDGDNIKDKAVVCTALVVANMILALKVGKLCVSYPIKAGKRLVDDSVNSNRVTHNSIRMSIRFLEINGYIKYHNSIKTRENKSIKSRFLILDKFLQIFNSFDLKTLKIPYNGRRIILRQPDTANHVEPAHLVSDLDKYTRFLDSTEVLSKGKRIDTDHVKAIYTHNYESHGRIYSLWQNISSKDRKDITINGNRVVELDYECMGPSIAYAMKGLQLSKDAYSFPSGLGRSDNKKIINILLNCKNKTSARGAIFFNTQCRHVTTAINSAEKYHHPISDLFFKSCGLKIMNIDAMVCRSVINKMTDMEIPVLCIHDGFITDKQYEGQLRKAMIECYRQVTGFNVNISRV